MPRLDTLKRLKRGRTSQTHVFLSLCDMRVRFKFIGPCCHLYETEWKEGTCDVRAACRPQGDSVIQRSDGRRKGRSAVASTCFSFKVSQTRHFRALMFSCVVVCTLQAHTDPLN